MCYTFLFWNVDVGNVDDILLVLSTYFSTIFLESFNFYSTFFSSFTIANISRVFIFMCEQNGLLYLENDSDDLVSEIDLLTKETNFNRIRLVG